MRIIKTFTFYLIIIHCIIFSQNNKLFWDGRDWNKIKGKASHDNKIEFLIKKAYLEGALDGRLYGYLKTWEDDNAIADRVFSETVDYLSIRELIKNIDYFYDDPLNNYIPLPSAIVIANMYAGRENIYNIESYIKLTREWINGLILDLDTLDYTKILEQKLIKQHKKSFNRFE